jgi:ABC-2 type transport system permease protein
VFSTGIAMLLSALFVRFRDIQPIWDVISQILFYCSPVIIPVETVREKLLLHHTGFRPAMYHLYTLNPLAMIFQEFRHAMINSATLSAGQALGSWVAILEPLSFVLAVFALGFWVFNRSAPLVAENL